MNRLEKLFGDRKRPDAAEIAEAVGCTREFAERSLEELLDLPGDTHNEKLAIVVHRVSLLIRDGFDRPSDKMIGEPESPLLFVLVGLALGRLMDAKMASQTEISAAIAGFALVKDAFVLRDMIWDGKFPKPEGGLN